jgi:hypothetical protein
VGCLFAYVIMSGSPVTAAAQAFFEIGAFAMITGSRPRVSFMILFIGAHCDEGWRRTLPDNLAHQIIT